MDEEGVTASAVISYACKLEKCSSAFYRRLAQICAAHGETFLIFAKENERNSELITRTYQETITDAIEACFAFEGLNLDDRWIRMTLEENSECNDGLTKALELESKASEFYSEAAKKSGSLLATIPQVLKRVAETRNKRKSKLLSMIEKTGLTSA
jgi:rubrerythrin